MARYLRDDLVAKTEDLLEYKEWLLGRVLERRHLVRLERLQREVREARRRLREASKINTEWARWRVAQRKEREDSDRG